MRRRWAWGVVLAGFVAVLFVVPAGILGSSECRFGGPVGPATTPAARFAGTVPSATPSSRCTNCAIANVTVGSGPVDVAFDPLDGDLFVTNQGGASVSVINGTTHRVIATVAVGSGPFGAAVDVRTGDVYVSNSYSDNVSVISGSTLRVVASVPVGALPQLPTYDPINGNVYVTNRNSDNVTVIDGTTVAAIANVPVGFGPDGSALDSGTGQIWVEDSANYAGGVLRNGSVSILSGSTNRVLASVPVVGGDPSGIAFDARSGDLYVANDGSDNVSVVNGTTHHVQATVPAGVSPDGVAFPCGQGLAFVPNDGGSNVSVINTSSEREVASIRVLSGAQHPALDPRDGLVYVADHNANKVSLLRPDCPATSPGPSEYAVTFLETGLPRGLPWAVDLAGDVNASVERGTSFDEPNGSYSYAVPPISGFRTNASGTLAVVGAAATVHLSFLPTTYPVRFSEWGLAAGTVWWANLSGGSAFHANGSSLWFREPNGTYRFTVSSTDPRYEVRGATPVRGYLIVDGAGATELVSFVLLTYKVTFVEKGLPTGTEWWTNLTIGQSFGSNATAIRFVEANGTFAYTIASADPAYTASGGSFSVTGARVTVSVVFS